MPTVTSKTKKAHDEKFMQQQSGKSKEAADLDLKLSKWKNQQRAEKALAEHIRPAINVNEVRKQYLANQEENRHAENAVLLSKHFGTRKEHEAAEKSLEHRNKKGGYSSDDPIGMLHHKHSNEMHSKYWGHINEDYEPREEEGKF